MDVGLVHFINLSAIVFMIGFAGILLNRNNLMVILMCLELMLLAVNINLVASDYFLAQLDGQVMVFFVLACAACEAAIGLAIFVLLYRSYHNVDTGKFSQLRG
jgi:NADH-quinone oxidoreductase subunit K